MNSKKSICFVLAAVMLLALAACGSTAPAAPQATAAPQTTAAPTQAPAAPATAEPELPRSDIDVQLELIYDQIDSLIQKVEELPWYYTVTDLDHDGNLEFIAASQHPQDRSTNLKLWTVSADRKSLTECTVSKDPEESFPDIMTDSADTYHDVITDTWFYMFYDNVVLSPTDVYTSKSTFILKNNVIGYQAFAVEHSVVENGARIVSHTDAEGHDITPASYNAAGDSNFTGAEKSSTHFEWLTAEDAVSLQRLRESIAVFSGMRAPTETFPVPQPAALQQPGVTPSPTPTPTASATASPTPSPTPTPAPVYLTITKNPTNEDNREVGGTATFVACANAYESLAWTFVDAAGNLYTPQELANNFGTTVSGVYSTTLSIVVTPNMDGMGVYCTFYYKNQTARTSTAYIFVKNPAPEPESGVAEGSVWAWNYGYVSVRLEGGISVVADWSVVDLEGDIYEGAPATVTWEKTGDGNQVTYCKIIGHQPEPQPEYASMSGTIYRDTATTVYIVLNDGTALHVDGSLVEIKEGSEFNNAPCVVYYVGTPTEQSIYKIDVFGYDPTPEEPEKDPEPIVSYFSAQGTAYHDTASTIFVRLDNGTELTLNADRVEINIKGGTEIEGAPCVVYYTDALSAESVYKVDINAYDPAPEPAEQPAEPPAEQTEEQTPAAPQSLVANGRAFKETDGRILLALDSGETAHVSPNSRDGYKISVNTASGEVAMAGDGNPCRIFFYDSFTEQNIYEVIITD